MDAEVRDAARVILENHARTRVLSRMNVCGAMCDFTYDTTGRMPFPMSFWDGPMIAGLQALAQEESER